MIHLDHMPLKLKLRVALLTRGVSEKGLILFLRIIVDRFKQIEEEGPPQCLELKMLNSIKSAINTRKLGIMQKFLNHGIDAEAMRVKISLERMIMDPDVVDIIRRHAKMTSDFKSYFEDLKNPSMAAAATSKAMVENCILLQASISNFPVTCVTFKSSTNTIRRTVRATQTFLHNQTGCVIYDVCAMTQLHDKFTLPLILKAAKESTGLMNIYGAVEVDTMSLLRTLVLEYPTLKVVFKSNDLSILKAIDKYVNCVLLKDDPQYNMLTAMSPCLSEKLFGVVEKHFTTVKTILTDSLKKLQDNPVTVTNGVRIYPSEKSFSMLLGSSMAERFGTLEFATLVNSSDAMSLLLRESVLDTYKVFTADDDDTFKIITEEGFEDVKSQPKHPHYGKKNKKEDLAPDIELSEDKAEIFIPTKTMVDTVMALHFYLNNNVSVFLLGARGCGKTLSFKLVKPHLPLGTTVKYLTLGESREFHYEVSKLKKLRPYSTNVVVIQNFNPKNVYHVHFAISLMSGRIVYDERKKKFDKLPNLTLFIERDCEFEDLPQNLIFNMAVLHMIKDENANKQILNETMKTIENSTPEAAGALESCDNLVEVLVKWHLKSKTMSPYISDHMIFRAFNGILANIPEDLDSKETFLKFVYSELLEEYSALLSRDIVTKELMEFDIFADLMKNDKETIFFYQASTDEGMMPHQVHVKSLPETIKNLTKMHHGMRGKNYNDRIVLSPHFTKQIISTTRALCRFNTCVIVGPAGKKLNLHHLIKWYGTNFS